MSVHFQLADPDSVTQITDTDRNSEIENRNVPSLIVPGISVSMLCQVPAALPHYFALERSFIHQVVVCTFYVLGSAHVGTKKLGLGMCYGFFRTVTSLLSTTHLTKHFRTLQDPLKMRLSLEPPTHAFEGNSVENL